MIGGVSKDIGGKAQPFRLSSRAMMALEDHLGKGVVKIVQDFQEEAESGDLRMGLLVRIIGECMNDGAGADQSDAQGIFDALGVGGAAELIGECITKAFPEAEEKPGNAPGPAKK